jgi:hypothetical protein
MNQISNVVPFPRRRVQRAVQREGDRPIYDFTDSEQAALARWYSAMRYAFPAVQAAMAICHNERVAAVGLYGKPGVAPRCLISKHEAGGRIFLLWATADDPPRILKSLDEIIARHIAAIAPPPDEARWLDLPGWARIVAERAVAGAASGAQTSPMPR